MPKAHKKHKIQDGMESYCYRYVIPLLFISLIIFLSFHLHQRVRSYRVESKIRSKNPSATDLPQDAEKILQLGNQLYANKRFDEAIAKYEDILKLFPLYAPGWSNLGNAFREIELYEKSEQAHMKAIELLPEKAKYHYNLGVTYHAAGRILNAQKEYQKAVELDPKYVNSYYNLGIALQDSGELVEAMHAYSSALQLMPTHLDARLNYCNILFAMHKNQIAKGCYLDVLKLEPTYVRAIVNLASFYQMTEPEQPQQFHELYETALQLDPDNVFAQHAMRLLKGSDATRAEELDAEYVRGLFDSYSFHFDQSLQSLGYQSHLLVAEAVANYSRGLSTAGLRSMRVLDLGAGTGLACEPIKQAIAQLQPASSTAPLEVEVVGVDLSEKMLLRAKDRSCYSELVAQEAVAYVQAYSHRLELDGTDGAVRSQSSGSSQHSQELVSRTQAAAAAKLIHPSEEVGEGPGGPRAGGAADERHTTVSFAIVVSADVLVYIGDLRPLLQGVHEVLCAGGLFVFTVEAGDVPTPAADTSIQSTSTSVSCEASVEGNTCAGHGKPHEASTADKLETEASDAPNYFMQASGRFAHSEQYIRSLAVDEAFEVLALRSVVPRWDKGEEVRGYLAVLRI